MTCSYHAVFISFMTANYPSNFDAASGKFYFILSHHMLNEGPHSYCESYKITAIIAFNLYINDFLIANFVQIYQLHFIISVIQLISFSFFPASKSSLLKTCSNSQFYQTFVTFSLYNWKQLKRENEISLLQSS